ncbi:MAG: hypothetical protein F7C37_06170 [Desulfurococcales archaeon]|nr:hypothetical protein [Desulfurococcales archaeon]
MKKEVVSFKGPPVKSGNNLSLRDWILALLAYAGGKIRGKTRLQKALFLVQEEIGAIEADYQPYKYGPYSPTVENELRSLEKEGLIYIREELGGDDANAQVIYLSDRGKKLAQKALEQLMTREDWEDIESIFKLSAKAPLISLLAYVYTFYPEWTVSSEIRSKIKSKKRKIKFFLL